MHDVDGVNAGYARLLLDEYLENPEAVLPEWRALFESGDAEIVTSLPGLARLLEKLPRNGGSANGGATDADARSSRPRRRHRPGAARRRRRGDGARQGLPHARPSRGAARPARLGARGRPGARPDAARAAADARAAGARSPRRCCASHVPGDSLAEALPRLQETYCGTIAYEIEHISTHEQRVWLRKAIESWRYRTPLTADEQRALYTRLCQVDAMERYLRRSFLGQKQFSLEGLDVLIPMLDESLELAAAAGTSEAVLGMAHRGRLNVLAHTVGLPYEYVLREFEGERSIEVVAADAEGGTGDVKYHLGARGVLPAAAGEIGVTVAANPSHLEAVNPVVEGWARAEQTDRSRRLRPARPGRRDADPAPRRRGLRGPGRRRRDAQLLRARGLLDGRHAARDHEQPGRLHDRPGAGPLDALLVRPGQGLRRADRPRERRRPRGRDLGRAARARLPPPLRPRRRHRPRRLPPLRPQRAGRGRLHAAADGRADRARTRPCASSTARSSSRTACSARRRPSRSPPRRWRSCARRTSGSRRRSARTCRRSRATSACRASRRRRSTRASRPTRCASLNEQLLRVPDGFTVHPKLVRQLERRRDGDRQRRDRLGPGRVARVRVAARRRRADPPHRPGHRARHVLAPPSRPARRARPASARRRSRSWTTPTRRSRSTTRRCPSSRASASSTATRPRRRKRSCCGRRSSATSPTARRRSSTSSS